MATLHDGVPREVFYDLDVTYIDSKIYNPGTGQEEAVRLRGYTGAGVDPNAPYVAPTIEMRPGQTVRMTLNNKLPADPECLDWGGDVNTPHCFNGTNLHTHGLWINPAGNGDNVLISINPGVNFQYEYNVPPDHPAGTFWYHPHRHGSTALQVSSGMAGALVIRGDRKPTAASNGDLDTLLAPTAEQPFAERILLFQQIQYACRDADGLIKTTTLPDGKTKRWVCDPDDVGGIERYEGPEGSDDQFGPGTWTESGRYTSVNGQVLPVFRGAATGKFERWRMIHAGVRDTIAVSIRKHRETAVPQPRLAASAAPDYIKEFCNGEPEPYHVVAADGLTTAKAMSTTVSVLQPGYRFDTLVAFDEPGIYCVIDEKVPPGGTINAQAPPQALIGFVQVEGTRVGGDADTRLEQALGTAADMNLPPDVAATVKGDLANGLSLAKFVPHRSLADLPDSEITGKRDLVFNIDVTATPNRFEIDGEPYKPTRVDRTLPLGAIEDWTLRSDFVSHPFHIHVNPFQILAIYDPNGKDVSAPGAVDDYNAENPTKPGPIDPQYANLKGVWKDTLLIKNPTTAAKHKYKIKVRTHYRRYIGEFVLHCHILDHEDQGMMQNILIALPDGQGGATYGHH